MAERRTSSRAENVRAKRKNSQGKGRSAARNSRSTTSVSQQKLPPVVMRGGFASMAQPKSKKKGKAGVQKRRYDIALSSPGVEIRLPAIPSIHLGWRLVSFALAAGLLFVLYHLWTAPLYQIQFAELQGNQYLNNETVNRLLNLYNRPVFALDPQQMESDLRLAFPGLLKDVSVQVGLPATVIINVQEREPVIAWEQDNKVRWVDADGIAFDPVGEADALIRVAATASPPAPIVVPENPEDFDAAVNPLEAVLHPEAFMFPEMVDAILQMSEYAPPEVPLVYDPQHGLGWKTNRGWDIYFGMDVLDIEQKLVVYKAIKAQLKEQGLNPVMISVEHVHAPYYRLEP
jgi:hypothetical protein